MQAEHRLLIFGLRCHGPHFRLLHRRPDRPRIGRIGFVRLHERASDSVDFGQPPDRLAQSFQVIKLRLPDSGHRSTRAPGHELPIGVAEKFSGKRPLTRRPAIPRRRRILIELSSAVRPSSSSQWPPAQRTAHPNPQRRKAGLRGHWIYYPCRSGARRAARGPRERTATRAPSPRLRSTNTRRPGW